MSARARAFTLIEVLMTIAITAMVFAMIGGILLSVISAGENIGDKLRTEKAGHGILGVVRRDLAGVYAYGLGGLAFRGEDEQEGGKAADRLAFVTTADVIPPDEQGRRPKLAEVGYRLRAEEGGILSLYRRASAFEPPGRPGARSPRPATTCGARTATRSWSTPGRSGLTTSRRTATATCSPTS